MQAFPDRGQDTGDLIRDERGSQRVFLLGRPAEPRARVEKYAALRFVQARA